MNTNDFFSTIYKGKPADHYILIWSLKGKRSNWFKDPDDAAEFVKKHPDDVYFGVGTSIKDYGHAKRCTKGRISGVPGLYVDIDVKPDGTGDEAHKGKKYPKSIKEALSLVEDYDMDPTLVVQSGYGLHCYWLFDEFINIENKAERQQVAEIEQRMNTTVINRAKKKGMIIDSVFDLSRVLRPVGSNNCKQQKKLKVKLLKDSRKFYDILSFDHELDKISAKKTTQVNKKFEKVVLPNNIAIDKDATVEMNDLIELQSQNDLFNPTWKSARGFKSQSEYDMSLANMAVDAGWDEQRIINLIIHHRRTNNTINVQKMMRKDYFERTIRLARENSKKNTFNKLADKIMAKGTIFENKNGNDIVKYIDKSLSPLKFVQIRKYRDEPHYEYYLDVEKPNGDPESINLNGRLQKRLLFIEDIQDATNIRLVITPKQWHSLSQAFSIVVIEAERSTRHEQIETGTVEYLEKYMGNLGKALAELWISNQPFKDKGDWFISLKHFHAWFQLAKSEGDSLQKKFRTDLTESGFKSVDKWYTESLSDGSYRRKKKAYMKVPKGYNIP